MNPPICDHGCTAITAVCLLDHKPHPLPLPPPSHPVWEDPEVRLRLMIERTKQRRESSIRSGNAFPGSAAYFRGKTMAYNSILTDLETLQKLLRKNK